jgi:hypothetical protein
MADNTSSVIIQVIERDGQKYIFGHCSKPKCDQYAEREFESMKDMDIMLDWKNLHPLQCGKRPECRLRNSRN